MKRKLIGYRERRGMKIRIFSTLIGVCLLTVASFVGAEEQLPREVLRIPHVIPTADELSNPALYRPFYKSVYIPPRSVLPPPPEDVVRPGEFDKMDATIISVLNYGPQYAKMWQEMIKIFAEEAYVWIIATSAAKTWIEKQLSSTNVSQDSYAFLSYPINDIWVRDYGPEFVIATDGTRHIVDASYSERPLDDAIPGRIGASNWINTDGLPMEVHAHEHMIAGGNIMTDGAGTCFFSDIIYGYEKPGGWSDDDVDTHLKQYLGCQQIIVLKPIARDGTLHIDLYAKVLSPTAILLGQFSPDTHFSGDYTTQEENLAILESTTNLSGEPWTVTRIPMLEPYKDGQWWVYRSYLNSQVIHNRVAMPSYYQVQDVSLPEGGEENAQYLLDKEAEAIEAYETAVPGIEVTPIDADHIIYLGGAIHCISHEIPAEEGGWEPPDSVCGDGVITGEEDCDLNDLGDVTCESLGYDFGDLACKDNCAFDETNCDYSSSGDTDTDTDSDSDSDGDTDTDTDVDTDTDADEDAGTDTGGDKDAGIEDAGKDTAGSNSNSCGCSQPGRHTGSGLVFPFELIFN
ncbi:MAG: agmatine deiminase family protein [Deltaproteobacteria bacterium]|nr:agmatine deiminase family protein [Deltaproteobacteria bacterium]